MQPSFFIYYSEKFFSIDWKFGQKLRGVLPILFPLSNLFYHKKEVWSIANLKFYQKSLIFFTKGYFL